VAETDGHGREIWTVPYQAEFCTWWATFMDEDGELTGMSLTCLTVRQTAVL
jgi:hypothetical protein